MSFNLLLRKAFANDKAEFYKQGQWGCSGIHPSHLSLHHAKISMCHKITYSNHLNFYTMSFLWPNQACTHVDEKFLSLRKKMKPCKKVFSRYESNFLKVKIQ